jgi:hypothetical protein
MTKKYHHKPGRPPLSPEARDISKRALLKLFQKVLRRCLEYHPKRRRTWVK